MTTKNIEDIYPLSPLQQGMLYHSLLDPQSGVYFEQLGCSLVGLLDEGAFERAWAQVVSRHSVLRTSFAWEDLDEPLQIVQRQVELPLNKFDWRSISHKEQNLKLVEYLEQQPSKGFDLNKAPLMRISLIRLEDQLYKFIWSHHHLLLDGWSMPLLLKEVFELYAAFSQGRDLYLPPSRPYRDYIGWLQQQDLAKAEDFWRSVLKGFYAPTPLTVDRRLAGALDDQAATTIESVSFDETATIQMRNLVQQHGLTLNTWIQAAWALLLSRYSGEKDIVFGSTMAGRPASLIGAETMLGLFINTLPVRVQIDDRRVLVDWLKDLQSQQVEMRQYEFTPLVQVQSWSEVLPGLPLFESILVFENYPVAAALSEQRSSVQIIDVEHFGKTNYPLTLVAAPGMEFELQIVFDPRRFSRSTVLRMIGHLKNIVLNMSADPLGAVGRINLLSPIERQQVHSFWQGEVREIAPGACIHELFEAQVEKTPDAPAVILPQDEWQSSDGGANSREAETVPVPVKNTFYTYRQLDDRANLLAGYLRLKGFGPGALAGISVERSFEMLVAVFGVLKAGGAYVPLDPKYPQERLDYMLQDAQVQVLLTTEIIAGQVFPRLLVDRQIIDANKEHIDDGQTPKVVRVDADWPEIADRSGQAISALAKVEVSDDDPVYVIYTSGSTGQPKGVVIRHKSLVNHALYMADRLELGPGRRIAQLISFSFDAAGEEIYPCLVSGAALVLPEPDFEMTGKAILELCQEHQVTTLHMPAPLWHQTIDELVAEKLPVPEALRVVLVGGESPSVEKLRQFQQMIESPVQFINAYGPTETTVTATTFKRLITPLVKNTLPVISSDAGQGEGLDLDVLTQLPIGRPISNVNVCILDGDLRPQPVGVPGEIFIGGSGVALGYLNRSQLTAEKFIAAPFDSSQRIYRTGDRGQYRSDGEIEFIGRVDHQVKLRGFRVELEEIEAVLNEHEIVKEGTVVVASIEHLQDGGSQGGSAEKRLVGFVVLVDSQSGAPSPSTQSDLAYQAGHELRRYLSQRLPDYMVPQAIAVLPELPRLPGGKINRSALAAMPVDFETVGMGGVGTSSFAPPGNALEEIVAGLWVEVLGIDTPDVNTSFFDLGGHSLKATQLLSRIRQTFNADVPLRSLFEAPTVTGMAAAVNSALTGSGLAVEMQPIQPLARDSATGRPINAPPLSFSQQRLWFIDQLDPGNLSYNIPAAVRITGELDVSVLEKSLQALIQRHESLRTTFKSLDGKPVQDIATDGFSIEIERENLAEVFTSSDESTLVSDLDEHNRIQHWVEGQVRRHFDLTNGPLIRAAILEITSHSKENGKPPEHILVVVLHHIIADGWSMRILIQELTAQYASLITGSALELPALSVQYADYAEWQRQWLSGAELDRQLSYWRKKLDGSPPLLDLPTDHPRPAIKSSRGGLENFILPEDLTQEILAAARRDGVTVYMFLLAAFQILLYRYSGQDDIVIGTAIANRTRRELEGMVGFFVNTLVMRTDCSGSPSFRELLSQVREVALGAYAHQDLPFEMLVEALQPQRNLSYTPIFQVGFDLQDISESSLQLSEISIEPLHAHGGTAAFDLLMSVNHTAYGLGGTLEYNSDLFERMTIERMLVHFQQLLQSIVADPDQSITRLSILTGAEREQLLIELNNSDAIFQSTATIHELFEEHAGAAPEATALIYRPEAPAETISMSYGELNRRSNLLAHFLRDHGVGAEVIVGISTERSLEMIVGILGILKAGGAYLPLDPNYPPDRLAFMLEDSQISILLTQQVVVQRLESVLEKRASNQGPELQVVRLDDGWQQIEAETSLQHGEQATADHLGGAKPEQLAYVIYTSGSTGKPKGTLLRHRGLCNLVEWQRNTFDINQSSRILQFSPFSFDASVWETFMALANGAALCLTTQETLANGLELVRLIKELGVTTVTLPPSVLSVIPAGSVSATELPSLRTVVAAGEACSHEIVARWSAPGRQFFDAYGPTETTVCATAALVDVEDRRDPPIGRPIANTHLYVVDPFLEPTPLGIPGELLIGGVGVARGYHNRPDLSKEKFIPNPYSGFLRRAGLMERARETLYRSGDLVRYRSDGNLEYLGRADQQVKVRGFRIELGEIEAALRGYSEEIPGLNTVQRLREAVVIARDDQHAARSDAFSTSGDKKLVAFVLPEIELDPQDEEASPTLIGALRRHLRQTLPEYMIPSIFMVVSSLPISPSGKIDRRALATWALPTTGRSQVEGQYEAPRSEVEIQLCRISADLLGLEWKGERSPIGIRDNFFEMGGHSLLATQFISRVRESFQVELPLRTLFEHPTIAELSEEIEKLKIAGGGVQAPAIQRVARDARRMKQSSAGLTPSTSIDVGQEHLPGKERPPSDKSEQ